MAYDIEGRLLEVCTCNVLCPCWVGEDPDGGTCDSTLAWRMDAGAIEGVDVAGLTIAASVHIPGNVLTPASWTAAIFVDERATPEQEQALLKVFTGQLGGAVADLAGLIGEVVSVQRAPIVFTVDGGKGRLTVGTSATPTSSRSSGRPASRPSLSGTVFSTIPGSPVYAAKSSYFTREGRRHEDPGRRRDGQQRPPGPLPVRGLRPGRCSPRRTSATRAATGPCSARPSPASRRWRGSPRRVGELALRAVPRPRRGCRGAGPGRGRAVHRRLGPDDPRDDAAVEHPARRHVRGARRGGGRGRGSSSGCCSPATSSRGRRSGLGRGSSTAGSMPPVDALPWLAEHPQLILGSTLAIAGLWQFSPLRDRCLDECRTPLGFVVARWRGTEPRREALAMGIAHGAFCVGCCWSLMLVMFGVGHGEPRADARARGGHGGREERRRGAGA